MKVAFQGEIGAYSEEAARTLFPEAHVVPTESFEQVFEAVSSGATDHAVIPIENSLFGSVHINYDLLRSHDLRILAEMQLRVRHHLLALPGVTIDALERVYSHPQALGQCEEFLKHRLGHVQVVPYYDTAGSARMLADTGDRRSAAIASERAGREYGLEVLASEIESDHQNYTRFLALGREGRGCNSTTAPCKTSIVYGMRNNVPGALFKSLAVFALREINLFKIESRPLVGSPGSYLFYLDFAGGTDDVVIQRALDHLGELTSYLKVLGSYPVGAVIE